MVMFDTRVDLESVTCRNAGHLYILIELYVDVCKIYEEFTCPNLEDTVRL